MGFLFGESKLDPDELRKCMDWLGKHYELTCFQDREAELFNNTIVQYGNSMTSSPDAGSCMAMAGNRLVQAADELLVRHSGIEPIPEAATADHYAWGLVFTQYKSWAVAQASVVESMAKGFNPRSEMVQQLMRQLTTSEAKAKKEEEKLLKRMSASGAILPDIQRLISKANKALSEDKWQPTSDKPLSSPSDENSCPEQRGTNRPQDASAIVLLKDKDWSVIDGDFSRVINFSPLASSVDINGNVRAMDITTPYAAVTFENKKLGNSVTGYIAHKEDFKNLWAAFKERTVKEDEEVIICWTKTHYKGYARVFSKFMPKLWVMICRKGAYDLATDPNFKPEITGEARFSAWAPIVDWKPDVME